MEVTVVGIDIAKRHFQIHSVNAADAVVIRRKIARDGFLKLLGKLSPCLVGMEAGSGAHYWAREIIRLGHEVRLMPPQFVRPYVKSNKNDAADAEACCEGRTATRHAICAGQVGGAADRNGVAPCP